MYSYHGTLSRKKNNMKHCLNRMRSEPFASAGFGFSLRLSEPKVRLFQSAERQGCAHRLVSMIIQVINSQRFRMISEITRRLFLPGLSFFQRAARP
jgi:hypothetical protein